MVRTAVLLILSCITAVLFCLLVDSLFDLHRAITYADFNDAGGRAVFFWVAFAASFIVVLWYSGRPS